MRREGKYQSKNHKRIECQFIATRHTGKALSKHWRVEFFETSRDQRKRFASHMRGIQVIHLFWLCCVSAIIPDQGEYESLSDYRRRLSIQYNYTPRWISPELCRTLTEDECRISDENYRQVIERNREILAQSRKLQAGVGGTPQFPSNVPKTGTLKVLVCLLQWTNHKNKSPYSPGRYC